MPQTTTSCRRVRAELFVPLLILMVSWLAWMGFQTAQLLQERGRLKTLHNNQEPTVFTAQQMRGQLDALAAGTKRLADAGHPHAIQIVQELARRGVTINPDAQN